MTELFGQHAPQTASLAEPVVALTLQLPFVECPLVEPPEQAPVQSNVVVPPVVSVPANSSPISRWKVQFPVPVQVTVNVVLVVLGDIAPKAAEEDDPLKPMLPSCVKFQPVAVSDTPVAAVVLTQFTPTTTASLAAFAEAVNVNVDAEELPPCCTNIFVCEILAHAGEQNSIRLIMSPFIVAVATTERLF